MNKEKFQGKKMYDILFEKSMKYPKDSKLSEISYNIFNNYLSCWSSAKDSEFRNKNNLYLADSCENQDEVAKKLSNLEKFYNRKFSNKLKTNNKRKKDKRLLKKYVGLKILEMRDRVMKKETYYYLLKTPEKNILEKIFG
ncbi:MAG TPA: hypothetical protein VJ912_02765 [Candidatus Nanoarchaeia archaeon]|nr:hypothetical protein [Candidatus Nanoarchaeia archaeon]